MSRIAIAAVLLAAAATVGCEKTGEGEYEIEKPVIGTETDTINTPSINVGTETDTITVPKVTTEEKEVTVPTVDVDP